MMEKNQCKRFLELLVAGACVLAAAGCGIASVVSPSDAASEAVSSAFVPAVKAEEAAEILVDGEKTKDIFLLASSWYGVSYQNEDSLNKLMMMKYSDKDSVIPQARDGAKVSFVFADSEGTPEELTVTQQGNTVQANTGIPYDIKDVELTEDGSGEYSFDIDFGKFSMYYYVAECRWSNGNTAQYAFALERSAD